MANISALPPGQWEEFLDAECPSDQTMATLWRNGNKARDESNSADATETSTNDETAIDGHQPQIFYSEQETLGDSESNILPLSVQRSLTLEARLRAAARDIGPFGQNNVFKPSDLKPNNQYPSILSRLPIFRPSKRLTQQSIQDADNAVGFDTPWGEGRRHGPPLTTRDEDTLIALLHLRDRCLTGPTSHLPESVRDIYRSKNGMTSVHRVTCTIDQINSFLGLSDSGKNYKVTLASIKRLNACKIEIENALVDGSRVGGSFDIVKIQWRVFDERGLVDAVFPPVMSHWLKASYTYIDWNIRKQLSPVGKALHRFLSGQPKKYEIGMTKLAKTIGFDGRTDRLKKTIEKGLEELKKVGWVTDFSVSGTGRSVPWKVSINRQKDS